NKCSAETAIHDQHTALAEESEKTTDIDLEQAADEATAELTEAKSALAAAESELAAAPVEQVEAARDNAVRLIDRLTTEHDQVEDGLRRLSVSLEMRGQEGLQEDYDQALTAREATRTQLQHLERRARACALLQIG